jgi:hypothetical protein
LVLLSNMARENLQNLLWDFFCYYLLDERERHFGALVCFPPTLFGADVVVQRDGGGTAVSDWATHCAHKLCQLFRKQSIELAGGATNAKE